MRWVGWEECKLGYGQVRNKIFILILSDCFVVFNINQVNEQINNSHVSSLVRLYQEHLDRFGPRSDPPWCILWP